LLLSLTHRAYPNEFISQTVNDISNHGSSFTSMSQTININCRIIA